MIQVKQVKDSEVEGLVKTTTREIREVEYAILKDKHNLYRVRDNCNNATSYKFLATLLKPLYCNT